MTQSLTLAKLIIAEARERGLRHFFGLPGGGAPLDLLDAGRRFGVEFVSVAHESSAAIMAAHNGSLQGTAGLALAIKGVGAGNLAGGAVDVYFERLPLIAVCECSPPTWKQRELVQHCSHEGLFGGITKLQMTLTAEDAPRMLQEAVFAATDGRPGPVLVNLPSNLGGAKSGGLLPPKAPRAFAAPAGDEIAAVSGFLKNCRRPVVIAGADVIRCDAIEELKQFAESIEAAVLVTLDARGVFSETHQRWAGALAGAYNPNTMETELLKQADSVVSVGVDAMMTQNPWKLSLPTCELSAREEYETLTSPKIRVNGDLKTTLRSLSRSRQPGLSEAAIDNLRSKILLSFKRPPQARLAAQDVIEISRRLLPTEGMLFTETGAFIRMLETLWPVKTPGTYFGTSGGRTMGLMLPAILGAKLARPESPMLGIGADGSLRMRLGELEVFARMGVRVPLVIINDESLGTMKSRQKSRGLPDYALDVSSVDFAAIARSCGLNGVTVDNPEAFEKELRSAMTADRTTLIDARVDAKVYQDSFGPTIGAT